MNKSMTKAQIAEENSMLRSQLEDARLKIVELNTTLERERREAHAAFLRKNDAINDLYEQLDAKQSEICDLRAKRKAPSAQTEGLGAKREAPSAEPLPMRALLTKARDVAMKRGALTRVADGRVEVKTSAGWASA